MPTISIVTPWMNGLHLLPDYAAAVQGAEVVTVDNASAPETAQALREAGGVYIRNETNAGFAAANNQGYAKATGDIIIFLNSDVVPTGAWLYTVALDVRDGALYGPSLGAQLVAGRHLPYLEGWCVAATRETWERLRAKSTIAFEEGKPDRNVYPQGPWDEGNYPGPYWEDNDLCLRALQQGINLVQTHWPIQHKGGQTAGPLLRHAASFAANERTFTERVLAAFPETQAEATPMYARYMRECATQSDIQHHLPLLYSLAKGNVLELGTRTGVSTAALLAGVEAHGGHIVSLDIDPRSAEVAKEHPLWTFVQKSSTDAEWAARCSASGGPWNLILIDTEHTYEQAAAELEVWHTHLAPGGVILMHDPETFPGVRRAAQEFAAARGWPITFVLPCNGMAVIERPNDG